jgi:hypothetical protein
MASIDSGASSQEPELSNWDDFDLMPIFADRGGLGRAKKLFEPNLRPLLKRINTELAAA